MVLYEFVQIMKRSPKTLLVRILAKEDVGSGGYLQNKVSPKWPIQPALEKGKAQSIRLYKSGDGDNWFSRKDGYYRSY